MRKFFKGVGGVVAFPFRAIFWIVLLPYRGLRRLYILLNSEPQERPLAETLADIATQADARRELWAHIESFRGHLLRMTLVTAFFVVAAFWVAEPLMDFLAIPAGGLEKLQAIQPTEEIGVFMRVAMTAGIASAFPFLAFEVWLFAAPGLKPREKKTALAGIPFAVVLFLGGMAFTYYALLPTAMPFLGSFTKISQFWSAREYFAFVTGLMLWIGLFFEFPLVVSALTSAGVVEPRFLAEQWRLAMVIIAVLAAAVTPTVDPVNMGLVMIPMIGLYFFSIGLSYIAHARRKRDQAEARESAPEAGAG